MICPHCKKEIPNAMEAEPADSGDGNEVEVSIEGSPDSIRQTLEKLLPKK